MAGHVRHSFLLILFNLLRHWHCFSVVQVRFYHCLRVLRSFEVGTVDRLPFSRVVINRNVIQGRVYRWVGRAPDAYRSLFFFFRGKFYRVLYGTVERLSLHVCPARCKVRPGEYFTVRGAACVVGPSQ